MAIPDYQSLMMPVMHFAGDGQEHSYRQAVEYLAATCGLSDDERHQMLPSGLQTVFENRVGWAITYLVKAGLLERPRRGSFRLTARGKDVLRQGLDKIDVKFLERFPEFRSFRERPSEPKRVTHAVADEDTHRTPAELLEEAYEKMRQELARELLEQVKRCSARFFERLVVDLLVRMGYGGSRAEAGKAVGGVGDEGIDGIINEDRLGLDVVYVQAKRWSAPVGRDEIQKFVGALQGQKARKGVFITTSSFTREAQEYARRVDTRIVLVDGVQLAQLMIDHDVGVTTVASYHTKRVDSDYFEEP